MKKLTKEETVEKMIAKRYQIAGINRALPPCKKIFSNEEGARNELDACKADHLLREWYKDAYIEKTYIVPPSRYSVQTVVVSGHPLRLVTEEITTVIGMLDTDDCLILFDEPFTIPIKQGSVWDMQIVPLYPS